MLKYKDLTKEQKKHVCNGCGGKGGIIKPPSFIFQASCNHHDFLYWRGRAEADKIRADDNFYSWMKEDIKLKPWYKKPHYHIWAYAYYKFVWLGGDKYFNYADKPKDIDDLNREMLYEKNKV